MKKLALSALVMFLVWISVSPAQAAVETDFLHNGGGNHDKCLDAATQTIWNNGGKVQIWGCNYAGQQRWELTYGATGQIRQWYDGKCLDADLNHIHTFGDTVQIWACNGSAQQAWWYVSADRSWHNVASGMCLDADLNHINDDGDRVQLWGCNGEPQQQWLLTLFV